MNGIAVLHTPRLRLRGLTLDDVPSYERHFVDYEVIRHLSAVVPWPYPPGGVEAFLRDVVLPQQGKDRWAWGLFLRDAPHECIGGIDLWREGRPHHRGFWLGRPYWGQGLMTEATAAVNEHAFNAYRISSAWIREAARCALAVLERRRRRDPAPW
jgi:[ribosomal protein S5]-alanine N-acetyltransferase